MKTLAAFVDLTKAFDKVWKEGLLFNLLGKRVCGILYSCIQSYLFQRSAWVRIDGQTSSSVKIRVLQGGVISPPLFVIFINDICDQLPARIPWVLHADDLAVWTKAQQVTTSAIRMREGMNLTSDWVKEWLVMINRIKTEGTCFSLSSKREEFILQINGQEIYQQDTPAYLGVKLDRKLTWSPHISTTYSKARRKIALTKKLAGTKWGANMKILTQIYTTTVRPHMQYAFNAWSSAAKANLDQLTKTQNIGLRIITGGMNTTPSQSWKGQWACCHLGKGKRKNFCAKAKRWRGFLHKHYIPSLKVPPKIDSRDWAQSTWSKCFSRNTGSPHQHATKHWKCFQTMRTGKQNLQPSSYTSQASKPVYHLGKSLHR